MKRNRRGRRVRVSADGEGLVSRAGVALLRELTVESRSRGRVDGPILMACAAGNLSPGEGVEVMGLIAGHVRVLEMAEFEARFIALEKAPLA